MLKNKEVCLESIEKASKKLKDIAIETPLQFSKGFSSRYDASVYLKREDLQETRSYKIRGAYNLMSSFSSLDKAVCASAGNHAQGVALSASLLKIRTTIFMPITTPQQKVDKVRQFGGKWTVINLIGLNFDESFKEAKKFCKKTKAFFVHPFDDERTISGQGTVGKEIYEQANSLDYIICPVGGGGLISGTSFYLKSKAKGIKVIGVEPKEAPAMHNSIKRGKVVSLSSLSSFVDGAAVKKVGHKTFKIVSNFVDAIVLVNEGEVCTSMVDLYQKEGIIAEPAGALSITALEKLKDEIKGKNVVCVLSGGNNDIMRYPEIMEKSLISQGRKHYFIIKFTQKPGQLKKFVNNVLGSTDDIVRFEYMKKNSKETGPVFVGIELLRKEDFNPLIRRMKKAKMEYTIIGKDDMLYEYLI